MKLSRAASSGRAEVLTEIETLQADFAFLIWRWALDLLHRVDG